MSDYCLYSTNLFLFTTAAKCVYCAVRVEPFNKLRSVPLLKRLMTFISTVNTSKWYKWGSEPYRDLTLTKWSKGMCRKTCEVLRYQRGLNFIWYVIYLLQLGFHPVAAVGKPYTNRKETAIYKRRNDAQNNTKTQSTQNRKQKYKTRQQTWKEYLKKT
jgi:hypothetical protein